MKNSKELCQPLCLPFSCYRINSQQDPVRTGIRTHYFAELIFIREGRFQVFLDDEEMIVSSGEAVFICPGIRHQAAPVGEETIELDLLRLDPDRLPDAPVYASGLKTILMEAWQAKMPMRVSAAEAEKMRIAEICERCLQENESRAFGYDLVAVSQLSILCVEMIRLWISKGLRLGSHEQQEDPVCSLTGYIQRHLRDGVRVEDLASRCGLSYPWFAKKFREIYGISCKDYIEQIRVAQVEQLLLLTDLDLARISEATGYADCSHMIKNFKRMMNITPGQYRLQRKK